MEHYREHKAGKKTFLGETTLYLFTAGLDRRQRRTFRLVTYLLSSYSTRGLTHTHTQLQALTFDLAESLVGESVGKRGERDKLDRVTTGRAHETVTEGETRRREPR